MRQHNIGINMSVEGLHLCVYLRCSSTMRESSFLKYLHWPQISTADPQSHALQIILAKKKKEKSFPHYSRVLLCSLSASAGWMAAATHEIWMKKTPVLFVAILHSDPDAFIKWLWGNCHAAMPCSVYQHKGLMTAAQPPCCCVRSAEWISRPSIILERCKGSSSMNSSCVTLFGFTPVPFFASGCSQMKNIRLCFSYIFWHTDISNLLYCTFNWQTD